MPVCDGLLASESRLCALTGSQRRKAASIGVLRSRVAGNLRPGGGGGVIGKRGIESGSLRGDGADMGKVNRQRLEEMRQTTILSRVSI